MQQPPPPRVPGVALITDLEEALDQAARPVGLTMMSRILIDRAICELRSSNKNGVRGRGRKGWSQTMTQTTEARYFSILSSSAVLWHLDVRCPVFSAIGLPVADRMKADLSPRHPIRAMLASRWMNVSGLLQLCLDAKRSEPLPSYHLCYML